MAINRPISGVFTNLKLQNIQEALDLFIEAIKTATYDKTVASKNYFVLRPTKLSGPFYDHIVHGAKDIIGLFYPTAFKRCGDPLVYLHEASRTTLMTGGKLNLNCTEKVTSIPDKIYPTIFCPETMVEKIV